MNAVFKVTIQGLFLVTTLALNPCVWADQTRPQLREDVCGPILRGEGLSQLPTQLQSQAQEQPPLIVTYIFRDRGREVETQVGDWNIEVNPNVFLSDRHKMIRWGERAILFSDYDYLVLKQLIESTGHAQTFQELNAKLAQQRGDDSFAFNKNQFKSSVRRINGKLAEWQDTRYVSISDGRLVFSMASLQRIGQTDDEAGQAQEALQFQYHSIKGAATAAWVPGDWSATRVENVWINSKYGFLRIHDQFFKFYPPQMFLLKRVLGSPEPVDSEKLEAELIAEHPGAKLSEAINFIQRLTRSVIQIELLNRDSRGLIVFRGDVVNAEDHQLQVVTYSIVGAADRASLKTLSSDWESQITSEVFYSRKLSMIRFGDRAFLLEELESEVIFQILASEGASALVSVLWQDVQTAMMAARGETVTFSKRSLTNAIKRINQKVQSELPDSEVLMLNDHVVALHFEKLPGEASESRGSIDDLVFRYQSVSGTFSAAYNPSNFEQTPVTDLFINRTERFLKLKDQYFKLSNAQLKILQALLGSDDASLSASQLRQQINQEIPNLRFDEEITNLNFLVRSSLQFDLVFREDQRVTLNLAVIEAQPSDLITVEYRHQGRKQTLKTHSSDWGVRLTSEVFLSRRHGLLRHGSKATPIGPMAMDLIEVLLSSNYHRGERDQILASLNAAQSGRRVTESSLQVAISNLNSSLKNGLNPNGARSLLVQREAGVYFLNLDLLPGEPESPLAFVQYVADSGVGEAPWIPEEWQLVERYGAWINSDRQLLRIGDRFIRLTGVQLQIMQNLFVARDFGLTREQIQRQIEAPYSDSYFERVVDEINDLANQAFHHPLWVEEAGSLRAYVISDDTPDEDVIEVKLSAEGGSGEQIRRTLTSDWDTTLSNDVHVSRRHLMIRVGDKATSISSYVYYVLKALDEDRSRPMSFSDSLRRAQALFRENGETGALLEQFSLRRRLNALNTQLRRPLAGEDFIEWNESNLWINTSLGSPRVSGQIERQTVESSAPSNTEVAFRMTEWTQTKYKNLWLNPFRRLLKFRDQIVLLTKRQLILVELLIMREPIPLEELGLRLQRLVEEDLQIDAEIAKLNRLTMRGLNIRLVRRVGDQVRLDSTALRANENQVVTVSFHRSGNEMTFSTTRNSWNLNFASGVSVSRRHRLIRIGQRAVEVLPEEVALLEILNGFGEGALNSQDILEELRAYRYASSFVRRDWNEDTLHTQIQALNSKAVGLFPNGLVKIQSRSYWLNPEYTAESGEIAQTGAREIEYISSKGDSRTVVYAESDWMRTSVSGLLLNERLRLIQVREKFFGVTELQFEVLQFVIANQDPRFALSEISSDRLGIDGSPDQIKTAIQRLNNLLRVSMGITLLTDLESGVEINTQVLGSLEEDLLKYELLNGSGSFTEVLSVEGQW
ncbi:MAG: hypothetical protein AAF202_00265, partial [Pseudomonadota bacterium]